MRKAAAAAVIVVVVGAIIVLKLGDSAPETQKPGNKGPAKAPSLNLDDYVKAKPELKTLLDGSTATAGKARAARGRARVDSAKAADTKASTPKPKSNKVATGEALVLMTRAEELLKKGERWKAHVELSRAILSAGQTMAPAIKTKLDKLSKELFFSPTPMPESTVHTVAKGEVLGKIAQKYGTTYQLLMRINNKSSDRIRIRERLKVLTGTPRVVVDKSDLALTLFMGPAYVKQYPVCIGVDNCTPADTFVVSVRQIEPTWYPPGGGMYAYGHPKNVLGTRWLGFASKPGCSGYGIHGTTDPGSVPGRKSMGCVRMLNQDVEELYDFVAKGTKVEIRE